MRRLNLLMIALMPEHSLANRIVREYFRKRTVPILVGPSPFVADHQKSRHWVSHHLLELTSPVLDFINAGSTEHTHTSPSRSRCLGSISVRSGTGVPD